MTVTKEITKLEKSSVKLSIVIGKEDLRSEYDGLLNDYSKNIQIPGFRKGKVPREVLVRKFGEALKEEALGKIIEKAVVEVFEDEAFPRESKPLPYSRPALEDEPKLDLDKDLSFSVVYDVLPMVNIEKWEGLEVEIPDVSIDDEDLNRELEAIRERNSIVLDKSEGAPAEKGDVLTLNYCELDDSGNVIEDSKRDDFTFTLDSLNNIYQFDDEVKGMKVGETKEFSKSYPEDDSSVMAGKTIKLRAELTALKVKNLPDLDDDLAQDVDEKYKTLEDLKNSIRERLNKDLENRLKGIKTNKILEKIMENTPVDIPESMVSFELDSRWRNLARRFNTDSEGLFKIMGNSEERARSIMDEWRPDANKALHSRLIIETLMEKLNLEASEEELDKEIQRLADESGTGLEEVKKFYEEERMKDYLKEDVKENKVLDILIEKNTLKTGKKEKYIDLITNNG